MKHLASPTILLSCAVAIVSCQNLALGQDNTIEHIRQAWQERQSRVRTARFEWDEKHFWPARAWDYRLLGLADVDPFPANDTTWKRSTLLAIDGKMARFEMEQNIPSPDGFDDDTSVFVFDGSTSASWELPDSEREYVRKSVHNKARNARMSTVDVFPVVMAIRPMESSMSDVDISRFEIVDSAAPLNAEEECVLLRGRSGQRIEMWLDSQKDFVVRRYITYQVDGSIFRQFDINYEWEANAAVWIPLDWKLVAQTTTPALQISMSAVRSSCELNMPLDREYFQAPELVGAYVVDDSQRRHYIEQADGGKREVSRAERIAGLTYDQLATSNTNELLSPGSPSLTAWISYGFVAALLLVIVFIGLRQAHRRRSLGKS